MQRQTKVGAQKVCDFEVVLHNSLQIKPLATDREDLSFLQVCDESRGISENSQDFKSDLQVM